MANAFDQFDLDNPFDQFDSENISPSNGKVSSLASEPEQVVSPILEEKSQGKGPEEVRVEELRQKIIQNTANLKGTGFEYVIEDMNEKLDSKDPILSLEHNIVNPSVRTLEDTPEYILRGLPQDVALELYKKFSRPVHNKLTGEKQDMFGPRPGGSMRAIKRAVEKERFRYYNPEQAKMIEEMGPNEAFIVGMGEGFYSVGEGLGLLDKRDERQREIDKGLHTMHEGATVGKFTGQVAPFIVPGGAISNIVSTPARIAAMGGLGAAEGNIIARGEGGDTDQIIKATGLGFLIGTLGEAALPAINSLGRKFVRNIKKGNVTDDVLNKISVDTNGNPSPEFQKILDENNIDFDDFAKGAAEGFDDPVMNAQRKKIFDDMGLDITEAQRTRNADLFNVQQDALRREGPVKTALERQEEILDQRMKGEVSSIGGISQRANSSPIEAITDKATQLDDEIQDLYKKARELAPEEKNVRFNKSSQSLAQNAPSNELTGGVVSALRQKMRQMGVIDESFKPIGRVSVEQAEELRKYANRLYSSTNGEGRMVIKEFKDSLDDDVLSASGQDLFKQARKAKADFERGLDVDSLNKWDKSKTSLVRDILTTSVEEDDLVKRVLSRSSKYKARHLQELKDYLSTGTEGQIAQGMQAWNDIRAAAMQQIKEEAFTGPLTRTGTQSLSRSKLENAMKKIGPSKMEVLFSPKEREFLKKLMAVATLKEPPPGTFMGSGPSSPAIKELTDVVKRKIPVLGDIYDGVVDKIQNRAADRKVLELIDDAKVIADQNEKLAFRKMRKSTVGTASSTLPTAAIISTTNEENDQ